MADLIKEIQELHVDIDSGQVQQYENAINDFNSLIEKGLISNRGYNIRTIEQSYLFFANNCSNIYA